MYIVIDFDGTCVSHEFPKVGKDIGAAPVLKRLVEAGHKLILFTMRSDVKKPYSDDPGIKNIPGNYLSDAIKWFRDNDISLFGIQTNPDQKSWTTSPKAYGQLYIDDAALGAPKTFNPKISKKYFIDWKVVESWLETMKILPSE